MKHLQVDAVFLITQGNNQVKKDTVIASGPDGMYIYEHPLADIQTAEGSRIAFRRRLTDGEHRTTTFKLWRDYWRFLCDPNEDLGQRYIDHLEAPKERID